MSLPLSRPVRRFALVLRLSVLWKVAVLVVFLALVVRLTGGGGP